MKDRSTPRIATAGLLAGLLLIALALVPQARVAEAACDKVRNVLIVGAGISGVAAARHIAVTNGECFKVTVLEARNRVGGRMWSRTEVGGNGAVIRGEMGAQWIQSATGNPITAIARRFKLNIGEQNGEEIQYTAKGKAYTDLQIKVASANYNWALKRAKQIANNQDNDISMEKAFRAAGNFLNPYIQSKVAVDFEFEYSGDLSTISAWYHEDDAFDGPDLVVTNGYDNVPKLLMKEATDAGAQLVLNFQVTAVTRQGSGAVVVTGKDTATGATQSYTAHVAILTLPLGVLKAASVAFFPALSARKRAAISRVGFGNVNKVFFFYNATFWPTWADEYFVEDAQLPGNRGRWADWVNLKRAWGMTALEGVAVGAYANRMAGMTEQQCITDAANKIKIMFPGYRNAKAHTVWLQRWNLDPYARGAYSYAKVGVQGNGDVTSDFDKLAEPEGSVLFAGEHTNGPYRASVHGGYLSGIREAKRVLGSF